jgi:heat shock protein HtpX
MNPEPVLQCDKPLTGSSKALLFLSAGGTILLAYLVSLGFILALLCFLACEFVLFLALARFALAGLVAGVVRSHAALIAVFFRSLWLRKGVEYRVQLSPPEAPELFEMVQGLCQKAKVSMPAEISLEMGVTAWVQLEGYRRGAGRTVLGIGLDLLAGLSRWELEGVLAHEITHAKLVRRGYKKWLNRGLARMIQLAQGLNSHVSTFRQAKQTVQPGALFFSTIDSLTRSAARFVAGCSRQDEFDADRGAAALCGSGALRSSLIKMDPLSEQSARIPWNERVARLQSGRGFAQWFVEELAANLKGSQEIKKGHFFKYSTHPSLHDRLAALPTTNDTPPSSTTPALFLLHDADKAAESLIAVIQQKAAEEERKDSRRLRKLTRGGETHLRPLQVAGVLTCLATFVIGLIMLLDSALFLESACFLLGFFLLGILGCWLGKYRDPRVLPVPDFAVLKAAWQNKIDASEARVKSIEQDLQKKSSALKRSAKEQLLVGICYEALNRCDYVTAHVAARFALDANSKSVEGALGLAVAGAALGQIPQVQQALAFIQRRAGLRTWSTTWGTGWALALCGDWAAAEAFLEKACQHNRKLAAVLLLRALSLSNRGKLQSALELAREACSIRPAHKEHEKVMVNLLLNAGYLREADRRLNILKSFAGEDEEIMLAMVRFNLLSQDFAAADAWVDRLKSKQIGAESLVSLGRYFETARQHQKAAAFYQQSLAEGFYPESLIGLARLETKEKRTEEARKLLFSALNTERTLPEKAVGPVPLFHEINALLLALQEPVVGCRGWIASFNGSCSPKVLANKSVLIYATRRESAEQYLTAMAAALEPSLPPILPSSIRWSEAQREVQPDGPVCAGIQYVLN